MAKNVKGLTIFARDFRCVGVSARDQCILKHLVYSNKTFTGGSYAFMPCSGICYVTCMAKNYGIVNCKSWIVKMFTIIFISKFLAVLLG